MVVSPSDFYKFIGNDGYDRLVAEGIIGEMNFTEEMFNMHPDTVAYKLNCVGMNDQTYGKFIETKVADYLKGEINMNEFRQYLPFFDIDKFITFCSPRRSRDTRAMTPTSENKAKYDLIFNNYLIDVKTYKKGFTEHKLRAFYLQILIYYALLVKEDKIEGLHYMAILNPVSGQFLYAPIQNVSINNLLLVFDNCKKSIVNTLLDNNIIELEQDTGNCFGGIFTSLLRLLGIS